MVSSGQLPRPEGTCQHQYHVPLHMWFATNPGHGQSISHAPPEVCYLTPDLPLSTALCTAVLMSSLQCWTVHMTPCTAHLPGDCACCEIPIVRYLHVHALRQVWVQLSSILSIHTRDAPTAWALIPAELTLPCPLHPVT